MIVSRLSCEVHDDAFGTFGTITIAEHPSGALVWHVQYPDGDSYTEIGAEPPDLPCPIEDCEEYVYFWANLEGGL